jgi:serine/threonine protein kinase
MSKQLDRPAPDTLDLPTDGWPGARRMAALRLRHGDGASPTLPLIPGWVSESTIAVGEEAHLVRVHRADDPRRAARVAKVLRPVGPDGERRDVEEQRGRLLREVVALRALGDRGCPGIPRVITFGVGEVPAPAAWYVMPHYAGGAMWRDDATGGRWAESYRGDVDRVLEIAGALAATLAALHEGPRPCVHGQVIAANVLLERPGGRPILADFGHARLAGYALGPALHDVDAAWRWRAPELDDGGDDAASPASDVFMLGGLIYEALSGGRLLPPASCWPTASVHERPEYSLACDVDDRRVGAVSALLDRMLRSDVDARLTARQVARACHAIRRGQTVGGRPLRLRARPPAPRR